MKLFFESILKHGNTYGATKAEMADCRGAIDAGNKQSLRIVYIVATLYFFVGELMMLIMGEAIIPVLVFVVLSAIACVWFNVNSHKVKKVYVFYYIVYELCLSYGVMMQVITSRQSSTFYLATIIILPLFYMDYFYRMVGFTLINAVVYSLLPVVNPVMFETVRAERYSVYGFMAISILIHFFYQSVRIQEIKNYKESNDRQNALEVSAVFDSLTRLIRRPTFIELFEKYLENKKDDEAMGVAILDIDHFKLINDTYGHQAGDEAIAAVAKTLVSTLEATLVMPEEGDYFHLDLNKDYGNIVSRLGGDEFIFILKDRNETEIENQIRYLLDALEALDVGPIKGVRGSVGLTIIKDQKEYDTCYTQADVALYSAKANGRNQYAIYTGALIRRQECNSDHTHDELTGLFVAETFKERAISKLKDAADDSLAIVNVDIENFKAFNSAYGFEKGDMLLKRVAKALSNEFSDGLFSRFSDDHFVGLVPSANLDAVMSLVRFSLGEENEEYKNILRVGVYKLKDKNEDINIACDHAKFACDMLRGRYDVQTQYYDEDLQRKTDEHQYIVEHLDEAIEKNWIKVYYQPIIRTYTGKVSSVEALARWEDPERGLLSPLVFVEALEQTRLIYKLDLYMLEQVCANQKRDEDAGLETVPISINISRLDFDAIDVVSAIEDILKRYSMDKNKIHIEITESAASEHEDALKNVVSQFQKLDYEIWMDDFGSGYSSLNVLKDFNFNVIKFDMAFLRDSGKRARVVLTAIVDMAKKLGLQTLAEGVETEEQYEFLKTVGCEYVQGYYFGKPLPYGGTRKAMSEKGISYEGSEEQGFYNLIGRKNVLAPIMETTTEKENIDGNNKAVAILEIQNGYGKFLMATQVFCKLIRDREGFNAQGIEDLLNDPENPAATQFVDMMNCISNGADVEKRIVNYHGTKYLVSVNLLARDEKLKKAAIVVSFSDLSEIN